MRLGPVLCQSFEECLIQLLSAMGMVNVARLGGAIRAYERIVDSAFLADADNHSTVALAAEGRGYNGVDGRHMFIKYNYAISLLSN